MVGLEAKNDDLPSFTGQIDQEKRAADNGRCRIQLFVTFFRKSRAEDSVTLSNVVTHTLQAETDQSKNQGGSILADLDLDQPATLSKKQDHVLQLQDHQAPGNEVGESKLMTVMSTSILNNDQKSIVSDFAAILSSIGGIKTPLSNSTSRGCSDENLNPTSSLHPLAYSSDIFQSYYDCLLPSQITLSSPQHYNLKAVRTHPSMLAFETRHNLELVLDLFTPLPSLVNPISPTSLPSRPIKLAFFDMDSTLILEEVIDELARSIGAYTAVSAITARAMADPTFDFAASLRARVALLKGVPADVWSSLQYKVHIAAGAKDLIAGLKARGCITGVISGGFIPMAEWLKGELGLDLAFANHLAVSSPTAEFDYEHLTGELDLSEGKVIVTPEFKRDTLIAEAERRGIPMQLTLAAGDGSNDLKMLGVAGLGIAWNAKPKTQEQAPMRLNRESLSDLLPLVGTGGP